MATSRKVYIGVPKKVDGDLKQMTKITAEVLGKLGCGHCHSGFDFRYIADPFIFNERGELASGPQG